MPPTKGDLIAYRSFAGETYDAEVVEVGDHHVDINVVIPGQKDEDGKMFLRAIRWYDDPDEKSPGARPKAGGQGG